MTLESNSDLILSVAVPRPVDGLFTYRLPANLADGISVGGMVRVPFGRSTTHAFVVEPPKNLSEISKDFSPDKLKPISEVIEAGGHKCVLPPDVMALCKWAHEYYRAPLGEVLNCAAPLAAMGLKNSSKKVRNVSNKNEGNPVAIQLTPDQTRAFAELEAARTGGKGVALLNGVTGSGKTELYIELAKKVLAEGRGVLVMLPEIALTSQLHRRFEAALGIPVGIWHSAVADGSRRDVGAALRDGNLRVIVGARSAVFAPVPNLGLTIVDEEHDPTYKQVDRVRYHARDLAVVRGKLTQSFVVLGSATPSMETRERVQEGRYAEVLLPERVSPGGFPDIEVVDLCEEERVEEMRAPFARKTLTAILDTLRDGGQVMIFLNRRGFAAFLVCEDCGEVPGCPDCSISLTVHMRDRQLRCHVCGFARDIPQSCQKCQGYDLSPMGAGTESLEDELPKQFPKESGVEIKALRLDRDQVTSVSRLEKILGDFRAGKSNVLLGTQMLVKGHDFPGVTLVVVVLADALFRWPDFRGPERAFQILTQVAGRAGRGDKRGRVLIQTFAPEHPVIQAVQGKLTEKDFLSTEREMRKELNYPPFGRLALLRWEGDSNGEARKAAEWTTSQLSKLEGIELLGPSEAFLEKAKGVYRWDLMLRTGKIATLQKAVNFARHTASENKWRLVVDVDPYGVG